jgi:hypothetical protein
VGETNWVMLGAGLLGGVAVGAVITQITTTYKARKQTVNYTVDIVQLFDGDKLGSSDLSAQLTVGSHTTGFGTNIENLSVITIELANMGNQDLSSFPFGMTLTNGDKAIHYDAASPDRHHPIEHHSEVGFHNPNGYLDFTLQSFNRGDVYKFTLYVIAGKPRTTASEVQLSSSKPVTFKSTKNIELALDLTTMSVSIGGIRISRAG